MLVFSVSDKGGTGRSVTSTNLAYRTALLGLSTCYLDFDFGSPTVGAIFDVAHARTGVADGGLHDYLHGLRPEPLRIDVWVRSARENFDRPAGAEPLVLLPGTLGGSEFTRLDKTMISRCADLFVRLDEEFDICLVDLSAGRSVAMDLVLKATATKRVRSINVRWLVFHRWTRQHIIAADNLVRGENGLIKYGIECGFSADEMENMIGFVRTAVINPHGDASQGLRPSQQAWLVEVNRDLEALANDRGLGRDIRVGSVPLDPVLQWREQLITERDVRSTEIANKETVDAFDDLAHYLSQIVAGEQGR
jgi:hypothetical protein